MLFAVSSAVLASAMPLEVRAGGPSFVPIPQNCTVTNPLPHASQYCGNGTVSGYKPSANFKASHQIYDYYLPAPTGETLNAQWSGCLEQCNGLDGCVSALLAYNAPTPAGYYGTTGGVLEIGCLMFNASMTPNNFVAAAKGHYVNETAGNIYCPA